MGRAPRDEWAKRVERWKRSGLTAAVFAQREGLNAGTLFWWSSKLGRAQRTPRPVVEVVVVPSMAAVRTTALAVEVRDGVRVRVPAGFDEDTLRRLLRLLEEG
jgi:transposase